MRQRYVFLLLFGLSISGFTQEVGSGNTYEFDGVSSQVVYSNIFENLTLPVTLTGWIFLPENIPTSRKVFFASSWPDTDIYSGVWFSIGPNSMAVTYGDGTGTNDDEFRRSTIASFEGNYRGSWIHISYVVNGANNMNIYINGIKLISSYSGSSNLPMANVASGKCKIGYNTADNFF
jgi:hypothetical protein